MDVTDTGIDRDPAELADEAIWLDRMRNHPPGLDPHTNRLEHQDLVATAAEPTQVRLPHEPVIGGEKERIVSSYPPHLELVHTEPVLYAETGTSDPHRFYDLRSPLGTPEGVRPRTGELW